MKKVGYIILTIILLLPFSVSALEISGLNSQNVIIYNLDEDKILYEKNADEEVSIASLTKIMTTILSIELIDDLDEKVTITSKMLAEVEYDASVAGLKVGDTVTYRDLLYASMLPSGADATDSLAISLKGSINAFVEEMNKKAQELNLTSTSFVNTTGIDSRGHYSSANDILTLLKYALKNETFKTIFTTRKYTATNGLELESTIEYYNRKLSYDLSYIEGGKTGFTDEAGQCLAALSNIDDTNIITITINAPYSYEKPRNIVDMDKLYSTLKDKYSRINLIETDDILVSLDTKYAKETQARIRATKDISRYIENPYDENDLKIDYTGEEIISSTAEKGTEVGTIKIYYKDELIEEFPAILSDELHFSVWNYLKENIIFYGALLIIVIITFSILKKSKKRKRRNRQT